MANNIPLFNTHKFSSSTALDKMLYEKSTEQDQELKIVHQAREFLDKEYTTEEIKEIIASFDYLINNWTEEYEKKVLNNKTLKELLQYF